MKSLLKLFKGSPKRKKYSRIPKFNLASAARLLYQKELMGYIRSVPGDIVECGVGEGDSFIGWAMALFLEKASPPRHLWGFDSFDGFPEPTAEDLRTSGQSCVQKNDAAVPLGVTLKKLTYVGLPAEWTQKNITFIKGYFDTSLKKYAGDKIALLHIDVDLYQSYKTVLSALYDKVVPGGVVAVDEYAAQMDAVKWPGAKKAIDEFFSGKPATLVKHNDHGKYYLIKPA